MFQVDEEYGILVDEGGLPVPQSELPNIAQCIVKHMKLNELEIEALSRRIVEKRHPKMVDQMNWDYFK